MDIKQSPFAKFVPKLTKRECIHAFNTSGLPISR